MGIYYYGCCPVRKYRPGILFRRQKGRFKMGMAVNKAWYRIISIKVDQFMGLLIIRPYTHDQTTIDCYICIIDLP